MAWKAAVKEKYDYAEDMLCDMAENLGMRPEQCLLESGHSEMFDEKDITRLYFSVPEEIEKVPPVLKITCFNLMICLPDKSNMVFVNNKGGRSKGVAREKTAEFQL